MALEGNKTTVTEDIGDEYLQWGPGDIVLITAPTGRGKTYFILNTLFNHAIQNRKKILYLVNRVALKEQIEKEINNIVRRDKVTGILDSRDYIEVMTYQELEYYDAGTYSIKLKKKCDYVVADECHYFFLDALYNCGTFRSYCAIMKEYKLYTIIYISATMDKFKPFLNNDMVENIAISGLPNSTRIARNLLMKFRPIREYSGEKDYSYYKVKKIRNLSDIRRVIAASDKRQKWLIFINDIKRGRELASKLIKEDKMDAIFIDASFAKNDDMLDTVQLVTDSRMLKHQVLVATSVLDNGISIDDDFALHIAVFADNYEEFLQMIGRRRIGIDDKCTKINLYLCARDKNFFSARKNYMMKVEKVLEECKRYTSYSLLETKDKKHVMNNQIDLRERLYEDSFFYEMAKKFLYKGESPSNPGECKSITPLFINKFAEVQIANLISFYDEQIHRFDIEGEDAFFRTQLEWLGLTEDEVIETVDKSREEEKAELIKFFREKLNEMLGGDLQREMSLEENKEFFKKLEFRKKIERLYEIWRDEYPEKKEEIDTYIQNNFRKSTNPFDEKNFNEFVEYFDLADQYLMERKPRAKDGKDVLVLKRIM